MNRFIFCTLLALFGGLAQAAGVPVIVNTGSSSRAAAEEDADVASSGRAVAVMASTRIEYIPALRVWHDTSGTLMVCRAPGETYTQSSKRCELAGVKDVQAGWVSLPNLQMPGHALGAVQVNETRYGPSLVLYWRAVPAKKP